MLTSSQDERDVARATSSAPTLVVKSVNSAGYHVLSARSGVWMRSTSRRRSESVVTRGVVAPRG